MVVVVVVLFSAGAVVVLVVVVVTFSAGAFVVVVVVVAFSVGTVVVVTFSAGAVVVVWTVVVVVVAFVPSMVTGLYMKNLRVSLSAVWMLIPGISTTSLFLLRVICVVLVVHGDGAGGGINSPDGQLFVLSVCLDC